jgi:hypothetical protein
MRNNTNYVNQERQAIAGRLVFRTLVLASLGGILAVGAVVAYSTLVHGGRQGISIQVLRQVTRPDQTVTAIQFNHAEGLAYQIVADQNSGKVLQKRKFSGRPQGSRQEFQEAVRIIRQDPQLSGLMAGAPATEGGFIVDGPSGHPIQDRYIQVRLLTPDRLTLLRVVLVDLTAGAVASARNSFE